MRNVLERIRQLQKQIPSHHAVLLSAPHHIYKLTSCPCSQLEREALLLLSSTQALLVHSPLLTPSQIPGIQYAVFGQGSQSPVRTFFEETKSSSVWYDSHTLTCAELEGLQMRSPHIKYAPLPQTLLETLSFPTTETERAAMLQAGKITSEAWRLIHQTLKPGVTEAHLISVLKQHFLHNGAEWAFEPIVAFGAHTAIPHHHSDDTPLTLNVPVLIDLGARYKHQCADMTRTVWYGSRPSSLFTTVEKIVRTSYQAARAQLTAAPLSAAQIDAAARDVIKQAGYGEHFIHSTGHGVGYLIHESPHLHAGSTEQVLPYQAITIEPGIYVPDQFGYRHENTLYIDAAAQIQDLTYD